MHLELLPCRGSLSRHVRMTGGGTEDAVFGVVSTGRVCECVCYLKRI